MMNIPMWQRRFKELISLALALMLAHPAAYAASVDGEHFRQIYENEWAVRLREFPLLASRAGEHAYDGELGHVSERDQLRRYRFWEKVHQQLEEISCERLSREECINYRLFSNQIENLLARYQTRAYLIPFTSDEGFFFEWARLPETTDFSGLPDFHNYLSRLQQMGPVMDEYIELMRIGLQLGFTQPQVVLAGRDAPIKAELVDKVEDSPFFKPFLSLPRTVDDAARKEILKNAEMVTVEVA